MCTTVTVREYRNGVRTLAVGGKVDASTAADMSTQLLLAHAPLLLHPKPRSALVIGLASGMTLGSAACHDLEQIDCAEISPAVVEASHFFDEYNGNVPVRPAGAADRGGRPQSPVADVHAVRRDHLRAVQPVDRRRGGPVYQRSSSQICRERLTPGGLACVWLQAYQIWTSRCSAAWSAHSTTCSRTW